MTSVSRENGNLARERCVDPILSEQDAQGILLSWAMTEKQRHNVGVN